MVTVLYSLQFRASAGRVQSNDIFSPFIKLNNSWLQKFDDICVFLAYITNDDWFKKLEYPTLELIRGAGEQVTYIIKLHTMPMVLGVYIISFNLIIHALIGIFSKN